MRNVPWTHRGSWDARSNRYSQQIADTYISRICSQHRPHASTLTTASCPLLLARHPHRFGSAPAETRPPTSTAPAAGHRRDGPHAAEKGDATREALVAGLHGWQRHGGNGCRSSRWCQSQIVHHQRAASLPPSLHPSLLTSLPLSISIDAIRWKHASLLRTI